MVSPHFRAIASAIVATISFSRPAASYRAHHHASSRAAPIVGANMNNRHCLSDGWLAKRLVWQHFRYTQEAHSRGYQIIGLSRPYANCRQRRPSIIRREPKRKDVVRPRFTIVRRLFVSSARSTSSRRRHAKAVILSKLHRRRPRRRRLLASSAMRHWRLRSVTTMKNVGTFRPLRIAPSGSRQRRWYCRVIRAASLFIISPNRALI